MLVDYSSSSDEEGGAVAEERDGKSGRRSDISRSVDPDRADSSRGRHAQLSGDERTMNREVGTVCAYL